MFNENTVEREKAISAVRPKIGNEERAILKVIRDNETAKTSVLRRELIERGPYEEKDSLDYRIKKLEANTGAIDHPLISTNLTNTDKPGQTQRVFALTELGQQVTSRELEENDVSMKPTDPIPRLKLQVEELTETVKKLQGENKILKGQVQQLQTSNEELRGDLQREQAKTFILTDCIGRMFSGGPSKDEIEQAFQRRYEDLQNKEHSEQ